MACCYSNLFNRLSGRVGRVIYYQVGDHLYARAAPGKVKVSFGVTSGLPGEDEEDGDFLRGDPADMAGPDLADVGRGGTSLGIYSFPAS